MKYGASAKRYIRLLGAVLALVLVAGMLPVRAAENSVLYNGSFDLSNISTQTAPGWGLNPGNPNHTVTIQNNVVYGNTGYALKIEAAGQSYVFSADFSVEAGATYILSYYIRVDSAVGLSYAPFINDSNYSGGWWKDYVLTPVQGTTDGWKKVSGTVTIPESVGANTNNPECKVQLGFKVYAGSGTFYLDQVSLVKTDINIDDPNLNFESADTQSGTPFNWKTSAEGVAISSDNAVYHAGSRSMYVHKTSLAEKSVVNSAIYLPVVTGNVYEISFWVSSKNADPTATVRLDLLPYTADGSRVLLEDGSKATVQGTVSALNGGSERSGWTKVVTRSALPEGTAYVAFQLILTRGAAEVWIDDIFFNVVEDGTDCVVYYEDFHAVDESGNISAWQHSGSGSFTAQNGGKLTLTGGEGYIYDRLQCLSTGHTYCMKGNYAANMGGTVQLRFYDYKHNEYTEARKTVPLRANGTAFTVNVTAPSHTYAAIYIGSDQAGTITVSDVTVYMTAKPVPERNYLDADWTSRADRDNVVSSVENYNGIPTLMIDGQPTASHFYLRPDLNAYLQTDAESRIANSGLTLYVTYGGNLYKGGCDPIWLSDGSIDYDAFDAVIYDTLAASDDALVMVNIGMFAPKWWLEQNPGHQAQAHNGSSYIALEDVSLTSEKFRQEAGQVLRQLISHMKEQPYYNRVFGLKISGGQSYEWMHLGTDSDQGPDYSEVSQAGFKTYLQKKYGTVEALQAAWGNTAVTFETAGAPGWNERCASSNVYMGDADTGALSRNMVDWNLWLGEASADSFLYYCQIAKEETDNKIIVGGYNGYLWTSNTYDSQGMAHTAVNRVLNSPYVDWIASPIAYNERLLGQSSTYMALLDSVQAHGKLYIAEQDNRTCLSESYDGGWDADWDYKVGQTHTMADTLYQQKRDFANALVNGAGLWQFDMYGGWLDDDQIYDYLSAAKNEYDLSVHLDRNTTNEVAVFVGDETYAYLTAENSNMSFTLLEPMLMQQRKHLAAMGAGYDTYAMSTLLEGKVPAHKLNIVLSPFEITEEMHTAIDTYLKTDNQVVVWVYLPGISTGTQLSLENVERATGFFIGAVEQKSTLQIRLTDSGHSLTEGIAGFVYGNSVPNSVSPLTYIRDTAGATVLGYNKAGLQMPGLAVKNMGDWTSVYSAAPCLDVQLLRNLLSFAGCHIYSENSADIIYSSNSYVALHSAAAGEKTIHLSGFYSVYDVFEEKFISMNTNQFTYHHQADDTHIFRLMQPNTYTVTASIQSGKGALSAPGLTQVTAGQSYTLKITPETGYQIALVTVNGKTVAPDENGVLQLAAVNENMVIAVEFSKQNLPDNWDFELGSFGGGVTGSGAATVISDSNVHSGIYSLRLNHNGTARDLVELTVHMNASAGNRTLTVSYWAKAAASGARALHNGAHFFTANWEVTQKSVYSAVYPSRTQWQQYTQELTVPAGTEIFQYQLYADTVNADIYIDDITITCDGKNMLINGGLERGNLTGNFTEFENTPEIVRSVVTHSGSYSAYLTGSSAVTALAANLTVKEDARVEFTGWIYGKTGRVNYQVSSQGAVLAEGTWSVSGQWTQQSASCRIPAGTQDLQLVLSTADTSARVYLDDLKMLVLPHDQAEIRFQEVYDDGTWRLTADDISQFAETYYKIPVVVDGAQGYAVAHKVSDILCIYPSFFSVYGGPVPVISLEIPAGALLKPVSPALGWGESDGQWLKNAQTVEVKLAEGAVKQWNLSLGGDLTVNFYADIQAKDLTAVQAVITVADKTESFTPTEEVYDTEIGAYRFSVQLAAAQMTDEIKVQLLYRGVILREESYTVRQYAQYILNNASMKDYHCMVREMLHYGGAAQAYFDYHTQLPANSGITECCTAVVPTAAEQEMTVAGQLNGLNFYGASLMFRHKVAVRYYFKVSGDLAAYTFRANGEMYTPVVKDGLCFVELPGINPQNWDAELSLTVSDGNGNTLTVCYSPMHYIVRMNEKSEDNLKVLLKAMYCYHLAAKAISAE